MVGLAAAALALPVGASATTGYRDEHLCAHPAHRQGRRNTTYEIKVIDQTMKPSTFKLGYRKTKVLKKGASQFFYYSFHLIGVMKWTAAVGKAKTASGVFHVKLQKTFSGDG